MNAETLTSLYGYTHYTLTRNCAGISHEESLRSPQPGGNCLNRVLGHIVVNRNTKAHPLPEILAALDRSQERLLTRLGAMSEADLAAPLEDGTLGRSSPSISFTWAYHAGQVGLLRRLAGKEGALR